MQIPKYAIGVDEVGRGAWAGPLLVVACRLKVGNNHPEGLADSKKLSKIKRQELYTIIEEIYDVGTGWITAKEIDKLGLSKSLEKAFYIAVTNVGAKISDQIVLDGNVNFLKNTEYSNVRVIQKADDFVKSVSAASIYAKVSRDKYMIEISKSIPSYGFETNVGYGTKKHAEALEIHGACNLHRMQFEPMKGMRSAV